MSVPVRSKLGKLGWSLVFLTICVPAIEAVPARSQAAPKNQEYDRQLLAGLPDGDGKTLLATGCTNCHSLSQVAAGRKNAKALTHTVEDMISRGSPVDPEQVGTLAKYLAANFGPSVNVNKASAGDLAAVPGLDAKTGAAIVSYREKNGPFAKLDDLSKVEGLSDDVLKKVRARLTVGSPEPAAEKK
jgi:competence ComEA-like helix-hairpin-helix protein